MSQIIFPPSPTDGQEFQAPNGVTYTYQATPGVWTAVSEGEGSSIPAGTVMSFFQATAPTGFTQLTSIDNKSVRIVGGAGGGGGGSIPFTTLFSPTSTYSGSINITSGQVGDSTISEAQLGSHAHSYQSSVNTSGAVPGGGANGQNYGQTTGAAGGNQAHTHSLAGAAAVGNFTTNFAVEYIDMILASKD